MKTANNPITRFLLLMRVNRVYRKVFDSRIEHMRLCFITDDMEEINLYLEDLKRAVKLNKWLRERFNIKWVLIGS